MKSVSEKDFNTMEKVFKLWYDNGFLTIKDFVVFIIYILQTKDISQERLIKMINESKLEGSDLVVALGQKLKQEDDKESVHLEK